MMRLHRFFGWMALFSLVLTVQCSPSEPVDAADRLASSGNSGMMWASIEQQLDGLVDLDNGLMDTARAQSTLRSLLNYADSFPTDSHAGTALFYAGDIAQGMGLYWDGVKYLNRAYREFPSSKRAPEAVLLQAFVLDEHLNQKELALKSYEDFIERYPNHPRAREVRGMISLLNEGEEAFIQRIKENQKP